MSFVEFEDRQREIQEVAARHPKARIEVGGVALNSGQSPSIGNNDRETRIPLEQKPLPRGLAEGTPVKPNQQRHTQNLACLTGIYGGKFFDNGVCRLPLSPEQRLIRRKAKKKK